MKCLHLLLFVVVLAVPALAQRTGPFPRGHVVDLTYAFDSYSVYWPTAEQFKLETGTNLVFVPYVDGGATLRGLLTNEIQLAFDTLPGSIGMIEGGKIKILAVGSPERWFLVPEVPTMKEVGFNGLVSQWIGAYVRTDTPPAIVDKLAKVLKEAANDPKVRDQYRKLGFETVADGPQETLKRLKDETDMWRKTIEAANIKVN